LAWSIHPATLPSRPIEMIDRIGSCLPRSGDEGFANVLIADRTLVVAGPIVVAAAGGSWFVERVAANWMGRL
jgi:hypothetical protein